MQIGVLYWCLLIIAIVFGGIPYFAPEWKGARYGGLLILVLLILLGWEVFGPALHR